MESDGEPLLSRIGPSGLAEAGATMIGEGRRLKWKKKNKNYNTVKINVLSRITVEFHDKTGKRSEAECCGVLRSERVAC